MKKYISYSFFSAFILWSIGSLMNLLVVFFNNGKMPEVYDDRKFPIQPNLSFLADRFVLGRTYSLGDFFILAGLLTLFLSFAFLTIKFLRTKKYKFVAAFYFLCILTLIFSVSCTPTESLSEPAYFQNLYTYNGTSWIKLDGTGTQGPKGDKGDTGNTGATGATGSTGANGADGEGILNFTNGNLPSANSTYAGNIANVTSGNSTLIASYDANNLARNIYGAIWSGATTGGYSTDTTLGSIQLKMKKNGTPVGNVWVDVYTLTAQTQGSSPPTGSPSPVASSDTKAGTSLSTSETWETFTFSTPYILRANTHYLFLVKAPSSSSSSHCAVLMLDTSSGDVADPNWGSNYTSNSGSTWSATATTEAQYKLYAGEPSKLFYCIDYGTGSYSWLQIKP